MSVILSSLASYKAVRGSFSQKRTKSPPAACVQSRCHPASEVFVGSAKRAPRVVLFGSSVALALLLFPARVAVQTGQEYRDPAPADFSQDVPAHFTVVEGQVLLERDARLEPAEKNQIVMAGDRLRTTTGRTEILFPDGSTLQVDENSEVDFLSDSLMRLLTGRVRFNIKRDTEKLDYRVDTTPGYIEIRSAGDYRVGLGSDKRGKPEVELTVFRGTADLVNANGRTTVRAGKHAVTSGDTEPSLPYSFNSASEDDFDRWVQQLRDAQVVNSASPSAQYLPQEVSYYANTMDSYGSWGYEEPYGAVWYPSVSVGWAPYYQGRWGYTKHYAWTWHGIDHWAWPTHHYGRWGYSTAGWYWVPGYAYSPAWVSWGYAPGYVGWCPIGPKGGGPLYDWYGWINAPGVGHHKGAWTVMASGSMGHNVWVTEKALRPEQLPINTRAQFAQQRGGPAPTGSAIARRDVGSIGAPSVPRGAAMTKGASVRTDSSSIAAVRGAGGNAAPAVSGFPAPSRAIMAMPDASPRSSAPKSSATSAASVENRGAQRAVPRGVEASGASGFPSTRQSLPDAGRTAPRAQVSEGFGRSSAQVNSDGFPSGGAVRAVPRGLEGPSGPANRAEPSLNRSGSNGSNRSVVSGESSATGGSNGHRAVPQGLQSAPNTDRGRTMPRYDPAPSTPSAPVMSAPVHRNAPVAAPSSAPPPQAAPRGRTASPPAAVSAPASAPTAGPKGGGAATAPTQGTAAPRKGGGKG